jgi:hypothetical protein
MAQQTARDSAGFGSGELDTQAISRGNERLWDKTWPFPINNGLAVPARRLLELFSKRP